MSALAVPLPRDDRGYFPAKDVRTDHPAGRMLAQIEVHCDCPYRTPTLLECSGRGDAELPPEYRFLLLVFGQYDEPDSEPCRHCDDAECPLPLDELAELWAEFDPRGMAEPCLDPEGPGLLITQGEREATYTWRARRGVAVRHPDDLLDLDALAERAVRGMRRGGGMAGCVAEAEDGSPAALLAEVRAALATRARAG